jgi:hypothetical protein
VTISATSSEKTSQAGESDRDTADQTRRMEAEQESSNSMDNMVPVSAQHTASNCTGGNASRRNESVEDTRRQVSILTKNVSEIRETMTTMKEMMKLSYVRRKSEKLEWKNT